MKSLLIYLDGDEYEYDHIIKEFESEGALIDFINKENISTVVAAYTFYKELEIEPFDKVVSYRIKET